MNTDGQGQRQKSNRVANSSLTPITFLPLLKENDKMVGFINHTSSRGRLRQCSDLPCTFVSKKITVLIAICILQLQSHQMSPGTTYIAMDVHPMNAAMTPFIKSITNPEGLYL